MPVPQVRREPAPSQKRPPFPIVGAGKMVHSEAFSGKWFIEVEIHEGSVQGYVTNIHTGKTFQFAPEWRDGLFITVGAGGSSVTVSAYNRCASILDQQFRKLHPELFKPATLPDKG